MQIQFFLFLTHSKFTQALRISKAKSLIRHFPLRIQYVVMNVVMKVVNNLNVAKTCQVNDIPTKVIKMNKDIFANFVTDHFNYCITYGEFPDELKHTDVISVHIKNEKCNDKLQTSKHSDQHFKNL